jgi:hypothetical protein
VKVAKLDHLGDAGPQTMTDAMTIGLASRLQEIEARDVTVENANEFERLLAVRVEELLKEGAPAYKVAMNLSCDYGPSLLLAECLQAASIRPGMTLLPWKTSMQISDGVVSVGHGYGAEFKDLPLIDEKS